MSVFSRMDKKVLSPTSASYVRLSITAYHYTPLYDEHRLLLAVDLYILALNYVIIYEDAAHQNGGRKNEVLTL